MICQSRDPAASALHAPRLHATRRDWGAVAGRRPASRALLSLMLAMTAAAGAVAGTDLAYDTAVLRGLDKVTARVTTIDAPVGTTVSFGTLEVIVRTCRKTPPEELPEAAAFLDIREVRPGEPVADLFHGWMFASSPALSAIDHAVYDLWVIDCVNTASTAESTLSGGASE